MTTILLITKALCLCFAAVQNLATVNDDPGQWERSRMRGGTDPSRSRSRHRQPHQRGTLHERIHPTCHLPSQPSRARAVTTRAPAVRPASRRSLTARPTSPPSLLCALSPPSPAVAMAFVAAPLLTRGGGRRPAAAASAAARPSMAAAPPPSRGAALRSAAAAAVLALALGVGVPTAAHAVLPAPKLPPIDKTDKTRYVVDRGIGAWRGGLG